MAERSPRPSVQLLTRSGKTSPGRGFGGRGPASLTGLLCRSVPPATKPTPPQPPEIIPEPPTLSQLAARMERMETANSDLRATVSALTEKAAAQDAALEILSSKFDKATEIMSKATVSTNSRFDALTEHLAGLAQNMQLLLSRSTTPLAPPPLSTNPTYAPSPSAREANMMIYRLEEEETESPTELRDQIETIIADPCCPPILKTMQPDVMKTAISTSILSVQRMGPKGAKPRPVRIIFASREHMLQVRRQARNLKGSPFSHISMDSDITPAQQDARRAQKSKIAEAIGKGQTTRWSLTDPTMLEIFDRPKPASPRSASSDQAMADE